MSACSSACCASPAIPPSTPPPIRAQVCELHRQNRYDLILLDLQMPGMDGFQVMEGLKEIEEDGYLAGAGDHRAAGSQAARARSRREGLRQQAFRSGRAAGAGSQHPGSAPAASRGSASKTVSEELEASREVIRLKTLAEQERASRNWRLAQETQESLAAALFCRSSRIIRIHAFNHPTRYVGGDFYDFLQLSSGEWMGVLADVSGKGMSAALLSSMVLGALSMEFHSGTQPEEVAEPGEPACSAKNRFPSSSSRSFYLSWKPDGGGQFISAGHNPIYVFFRAATGSRSKA